MKRTWLVGWGSLVLAAATAAADDFAGGIRDFKWRFSASAFRRTFQGVSFTPGSSSTPEDVPAVPNGIRGARAAIGPDDGPADRNYRDGWIVDEGRFIQGPGQNPVPVTSDWGVADPSQAQGGRAVFTAPDGVQSASLGRQTEDTDGTGSGSEASSAWGGAIEAELLYRQNSNVWRGVLFNYSRLGQEESRQSRSFRDTQAWNDHERTVTDTFETVGALLVNDPAQRVVDERSAGRHVQRAVNQVEQELDFELHTFSLGVSRERRWGRLFAQVSAGPTINLASSEAKRTETLWVSRDGGPARAVRTWSDESSSDEIRFGGFAQGSARYRLSRYLQAGLIARFDVAGRAGGQVGPGDYAADLDGFTLAFQLGREW